MGILTRLLRKNIDGSFGLHGRTAFSTFPRAGSHFENHRHADDDGDWMVRFVKARLRFADSSPGEGTEGHARKCGDVKTLAVDHLDIHRTGGHLLCGANGSGKSLLLRSMIDPESVHNIIESDDDDDGRHRRQVGEQQCLFRHRNHDVETTKRPLVAHVSFESHQQLLLESSSATTTTSPQHGGSKTTYAALSPGGHFSKAAEFLVVRFGLFPLLYRDVTTLSTGEIRKVLLIRALVQQPRILILDNAFDGLDVASRTILKDIVRKTIAGFRMDILVQGVSAQNVPATQVILATHRAEEVVDNIARVSVIDNHGTLVTHDRGSPQFDRLLRDDAAGLDTDGDTPRAAPWSADDLPTVDALRIILPAASQSGAPRTAKYLVKMVDMEVKGGDKILLSNLTWTIEPGQRWLVSGSNGAGKSTLSRLLAHPSIQLKGLESTLVDVDVGWVSTERHVQLSKSDRTTEDVLFENCTSTDERIWNLVLRFFGLNDAGMRQRPFARLSQGQQKMVLVANGLLKTPRLLILDEPLQGLDVSNRRKVLGLVERWCQASNMSFVYITHHLEETIPSIQSVLHLSEGRVVYSGYYASYDPDLV
jgi:molybdate transport system ATP-binding protein